MRLCVPLQRAHTQLRTASCVLCVRRHPATGAYVLIEPEVCALPLVSAWYAGQAASCATHTALCASAGREVLCILSSMTAGLPHASTRRAHAAHHSAALAHSPPSSAGHSKVYSSSRTKRVIWYPQKTCAATLGSFSAARCTAARVRAASPCAPPLWQSVESNTRTSVARRCSGDSRCLNQNCLSVAMVCVVVGDSGRQRSDQDAGPG